jgi:hypothetical protein
MRTAGPSAQVGRARLGVRFPCGSHLWKLLHILMPFASALPFLNGANHRRQNCAG